MKRSKLRRLVREVLREQASQVGPTAVTFRQLTIDWEERIVHVGDRVIRPAEGTAAITFPILSTEAVLVPRGWEIV